MNDFQRDLAFGLDKEEKLVSLFNDKFNVKFIKKATFDSFDFTSDTIELELKSRKNNYITFPTTIVPKSKVDSIKKNKRFIFAFAFYDGIYYIEYDKEVFDTIECKMFLRNYRTGYKDKKQLYYFIPVSILKKI